ncbi:hypothetical protein GCU56_04140 [Geodermatophilus sabuli]|uniref:Uncharacterized protein n=1 Tax=Geodermatophilus sabuli TaxID=1564158 RepID=A0A7K3VWS0_9ACTN|nr:hypothetical protein [Geodermatophilus sabuli]NEK57062.1 hypothetical protein [Geodermatophilus sabuli]
MSMPPLAEVPVRSSLALTRRWVALLGPLSFDRRTLWLTWFDPDGRQSPAVVPIEDVPHQPDDRFLRGLLALADGRQGDDGLLALALGRPGEAVATDDDSAWVRGLHEVLGDDGWSLHLAAGGRVETLVEPGPTSR